MFLVFVALPQSHTFTFVQMGLEKGFEAILAVSG